MAHKDGLVILAGLAAALVGMMRQPRVGTPALQRQLQDLQRGMLDIHRAAAADHEFRRYPDPGSSRCRRHKLTVEHIGRDGLVVIAHCDPLEPFPDPRDHALRLHQPDAPLSADALAVVVGVAQDPRTAVALAAGRKVRPHLLASPRIGRPVRRHRSSASRIQPTALDAQDAEQSRERTSSTAKSPDCEFRSVETMQ